MVSVEYDGSLLRQSFFQAGFEEFSGEPDLAFGVLRSKGGHGASPLISSPKRWASMEFLAYSLQLDAKQVSE